MLTDLKYALRMLEKAPGFTAIAMVTLLASLKFAHASPAPDSISAPTAELDGDWSGEIRHGSDTGFVGLRFEARPDGGTLVREWLPNINAYDAAIGHLVRDGNVLTIPEVGATLARKGEVITGALAASELTFSVKRPAASLPTEPTPLPVATGPEPVWSYQASGPIWASPIVADGIVYVGDSSGRFHAIDAANGKSKWTYDARTPLFGPACVSANFLFVLGDSGDVIKLSRVSGTEVWRANIGGGDIKRVLPSLESSDWDHGTSTPLVDGDRIYMGSATGVFHALEAATGKRLWQFKTHEKIRAGALVAGDLIYVGSVDHNLYALNRNNGSEAWRFDTGSAVETEPVLAGDKVIIGTRDKSKLYALEARNGKLKWEVYYWLSWVESTPRLVDSKLYIGSSDSRRIRAIDPTNDKMLWTSQVWGWTWGSPLVVKETIYFATAGAEKYFVTQRPSIGALDRKTGSLRWRKELPLSKASFMSGYVNSLASADGKVIAAGLDGSVTAYPIQ